MHVITARNVHQALPLGLAALAELGVRRESRNGDVLVMPGPVTTLYDRPYERVMLWPERDCNPFFHFYEGLWMLAGRNDVAGVAHFVKRMATFSDDGRTLHGAYGHRWRLHFGFDQLGQIIEALKANPDDRRNVLQMWDATVDLGREGRDVPCNTQVYFSRDGLGRLDMTVCCRSNDVIWGAYGANAVHFSMLQEYMASAIGCPVGRYWQVSNNFHAYLDTYEPLVGLVDRAGEANPYGDDPGGESGLCDYPMMSTPVHQWQQELGMFLSEGVVIGMRDPFFRKVATPILAAWDHYKMNIGIDRYEGAEEILRQCHASDWRRACQEWIERRRVKYLQAADDGVSYE